MTCPLCAGERLTPIVRDGDPLEYRACADCDLRFLRPDQRLTPARERTRYDSHQYAYDDAGYAQFVRPLIEALERRVAPGARGLDFGAGRVPVLARWLTERGRPVEIYDSFYWPDEAPLAHEYDFVTSCEVVEHLFEPAREFARLRQTLRPGAPLLIMTALWDDDSNARGDFHDWYYRRDPTHVSFYSARTFDWIARAFGFSVVEIAGRVVCLGTPGG